MNLQLRVRLVLICSFILLKVCVPLVKGRYLIEVELFGYDNPTQTCQNCRPGQFADPGCCDHHDRSICTSNGDRCDSFFIYCLRTIGSTGICSYFGNQMSLVNPEDGIIDFNQSLVLGLDNPLQLQGLTDAYENGIQIYIEIQDRDDDTADDFVDVILINHTAPVGINSGRRNYTGVFGFVSMVLSSTVLCAPNFQGTDCTQCTRAGFTGPNCADQISINDCVGVDCGNGVCVNGLNSYSCTCDPGFTGEFCRTNIPNIPSDAVTTSADDRDIISRGSDPIGPIIGGILGGLCLLLFLLLLVVTLIVILVKIRKSKDKTKYTHQEELVPASQGMKTALNQLYDGSGGDDEATDNNHPPLYEEVGDIRAQDITVSPSDCSSTVKVGSVLVNNPIYGNENGTVGVGEDIDRYNQTFQQPVPPAEVNNELSASYGRLDLQASIIEKNVAYGRGYVGSTTCDSELEDNPLYGGGGGMNAIFGDGTNSASSPPQRVDSHHQYDQTFQPIQSTADGANHGQGGSYNKLERVSPSPGPEATSQNHAYDNVH